MSFISLRRKTKTQSGCQKKNLVFLVAYDSTDISLTGKNGGIGEKLP
jgi:hypothetical protein